MELPLVFCLAIFCAKKEDVSLEESISISQAVLDVFKSTPTYFGADYDNKLKIKYYKSIDELRKNAGERLTFFSCSEESFRKREQCITELRFYPGKKHPLLKVSKEYKELGCFTNQDLMIIRNILLAHGFKAISVNGFFMKNHNDAHLFGGGIGVSKLSSDESKTGESLTYPPDLEKKIWDAFWMFYASKTIINDKIRERFIKVLDKINALYIEDKYGISIQLPVDYDEAAVNKESLIPYKKVLREWLRHEGLILRV